MKKMIIVLSILTIMIGVGIAEIIVTNRIFGTLNDNLCAIEVVMEQNPKQVDDPEIIKKVDKTMELWEKSRMYLFIVNNHATMRNLDEKLVMLKKQVQINADQDAPVTLSMAINYTQELREDNYPKIVNLF